MIIITDYRLESKDGYIFRKAERISAMPNLWVSTIYAKLARAQADRRERGKHKTKNPPAKMRAVQPPAS